MVPFPGSFHDIIQVHTRDTIKSFCYPSLTSVNPPGFTEVLWESVPFQSRAVPSSHFHSPNLSTVCRRFAINTPFKQGILHIRFLRGKPGLTERPDSTDRRQPGESMFVYATHLG